MGILKTLLIVTIPGGGLATYFAFKLGPELVKASRNFGRNIGMGYNYFKVLLKVFAPASQAPAETLDMIRKTNQQIQALNRELRANVLKAKNELKETFPEELKVNPFEILSLRQEGSPEKPKEEWKSASNGTQLLSCTLDERDTVRQKKKEKKQRQNFIKNI